MSGSLPNILIILLAIGTYGSLAFVIMRFALRQSRDLGARAARAAGRDPVAGPGLAPARSAVAALTPDAVLDVSTAFPAPVAAGAPPRPGSRAG